MDQQTLINAPPDALAAERTQMAVAPGAEVTQAALVIECPICHTANPPGDRWCQDCGFLLTSQAPEALELPAASGPRLVLDGREFELHAGENTIGRVGADVLVPDPTVSRHHATLTIEDEAAWIEDAGSTNGTSLNGAPVPAGSRSRIADGDTVKLGNVSLKLVWPDHAPAGLPAAGGESLSPAASPVVAFLVAADGAELALRAGVTTLGRRAENKIPLSGDAYVSGRHAEIRCEQPIADGEGGCVLVDVGSTNGTFLRREPDGEEERLRPHDPQPLASGSQIRLGQSIFTFRPARAVVEEELAGEEMPLVGETADRAGDEAGLGWPEDAGVPEPREA